MSLEGEYISAWGSIRIALAGEAMITRALKPFREEEFLELQGLLSDSDVSIANGEMLFHNYEDPPTSLTGTWTRCDPRYLEDLTWFGIDALSCANNHGWDFGENGVITNVRNLDKAGVTHAGSGADYYAAIAPAYRDTARGRVALVSASTSGRHNIRAGAQRRDLRGRPGINLIRWISEWTVDELAFRELKRVADALGWVQYAPRWWRDAYEVDSRSDGLYFPDRNSQGLSSEDPVARFLPGRQFESHSYLHANDLRRNIESVAEARAMADFVVFAIHNHEGGPRSANHRSLERSGVSLGDALSDPSEHVEALAHAVIDAGADVVVGHGPHRDRGIEIYKKRPIIYSLGNFIIENDTVLKQPQDSFELRGLGPESSVADFYERRNRERSGTPRLAGSEFGDPKSESAVVIVKFEAGDLAAVEIHPIHVGDGLPRSQYGRPMIARGAIAHNVISRIQRMSEAYGTKIAEENGVGFIRLES